MKKQLCTVAALSIAAQTAQAHEGAHSANLMANIWHMLSQPDHWLLLAGFVAVTTITVTVARKSLSKKKASKSAH